MTKRLLIPALTLLALCALILAPAPESAAAGGLDASFSCEPGFNGEKICYANTLVGVTHQWSASGKARITGSSTGVAVYVSCWGSGGFSSVTHTVSGHGSTATSSVSGFCN